MKDIAKHLEFENVKLPLIKGHTRIELTSVKDGSKRIIEHDNTFQSDVIARQLRAFGASNASPWNNNTWNNNEMWRNLVGGILLFRDTIDLSDGDVPYMPSGNQMTANGAYNVVNNDIPVELGSYNSIESSTGGADSLVFVYDWGTSQGNGTISCICLTSETGGYIGYGNPSGESNSTLRNLFVNQTSSDFSQCLAYNGFRYIVSEYDRANKKVTITKQIDNMTKTSIFANQDATSKEYTFTGTVLEGGSYTSRIHVKQISKSKLVIVSGSNVTIPNGSTGDLLVFDAEADELTKLTINNTSGKTILIMDGSAGTSVRHVPQVDTDSQGNIFCMTKDSTNSPCSVLKFASDGTFIELLAETMGSTVPKGGALTNDIMVLSSSANMLFYGNEDDYLPTNGSFVGDRNAIDYNEYLDCLMYHNNSDPTVKFYKNPLYLATVNNLETPVVKDNTQTMKVIYTLTEA